VAGLLALLLLTESRRASRIRPDGSLALLGEQDRSRWHRGLIDEGQAIVRRCLRHNQPGPYQLQAAINAVHADAATVQDTDWSQIVALYDHRPRGRPDTGRCTQPRDRYWRTTGRRRRARACR
jgi:RNA polymerase sigma-70 factor, ECF subfamily